MKIKMRKRLFGLVLLFSAVILAPGQTIADEPSRVVIMPFNIHADRDLSFLKEGIVDMLTSRLSWEDRVVVVGRKATDQALKNVSGPLNEEIARAIATSLQADYILFGSLTIFGNSVSLDGKMVDVHQKRPTLNFFKQGNEIDEVIPQINLFATEIKERVFGRPVAARPRPPKGPERPALYAHPESLLAGKSSDQAKVSSFKPAPGAAGGFAESADTLATDITPPGFWKSHNFNFAINGVALGDVDGDGKTEVVFISKQRVYVHRFENQRLFQIWEKAAKRHGRLIAVDVADVNANGRAEIFVTSLKGGGDRLDSFVLEWNGNSFQPLSEGDSWYYRVINLPDRGRVLLGQKRTMDEAFVPGVYQLAWRNGQYAPQERLTLPKGINIFGFGVGDVMNNGRQMIVAFDEGDHLRIFSRSGEEKWKSGERYGGSMNYVESWSKNEDVPDRLYLPQRIYVHDFDGDGKQEVVVASNEGTLGRLFARLRRFTSGYMASLSWSSLGLVLNRQTPKLSGYVSDFAIGDFDNDGTHEVVVAHVGKGGIPLISRAKSSIVGYEMPQPLSSASGISISMVSRSLANHF
ncbi:MAG: VCBS repeat-containing protein [Desulfobacterales bacterium]|nr:VCBS repeat-containing protein [Desulfobacterales bacterium]